MDKSGGKKKKKKRQLFFSQDLCVRNSMMRETQKSTRNTQDTEYDNLNFQGPSRTHALIWPTVKSFQDFAKVLLKLRDFSSACKDCIGFVKSWVRTVLGIQGLYGPCTSQSPKRLQPRCPKTAKHSHIAIISLCFCLWLHAWIFEILKCFYFLGNQQKKSQSHKHCIKNTIDNSQQRMI